jgi:hypothetical protein
MQSTQTSDRDVRRITPTMRRMLYIAATLVFIAGIQLFVLTEHTDRFFAWTIGVPLTAAFLGAGYWANARGRVPGLDLHHAHDHRNVPASGRVPHRELLGVGLVRDLLHRAGGARRHSDPAVPCAGR